MAPTLLHSTIIRNLHNLTKLFPALNQQLTLLLRRSHQTCLSVTFHHSEACQMKSRFIRHILILGQRKVLLIMSLHKSRPVLHTVSGMAVHGLQVHLGCMALAGVGRLAGSVPGHIHMLFIHLRKTPPLH